MDACTEYFIHGGQRSCIIVGRPEGSPQGVYSSLILTVEFGEDTEDQVRFIEIQPEPFLSISGTMVNTSTGVMLQDPASWLPERLQPLYSIITSSSSSSHQ